MFERFTDTATKAVKQAQEEARAVRHRYIGTEHLLLGLLDVPDTVAAAVLAELGITRDDMRAKVGAIRGEYQNDPPPPITPFTPRAKRVLELALREALNLGHNFIGTEHILLGLVRENEGVAARILIDFDADATTIRNAVIRKLSGSPIAMTKAEVFARLAEAKAKVDDPRELVGKSVHPWVREWAETNQLPVRETGFCPDGRCYIIGAVPVEGVLFP